MQTERKDNIDFEENAAPPLPPTPHFDEQGIAAAKPVQLLRPRSSYGRQWARLWRRHLGLFAIAAFGLLFASSIAVAWLEFNLAPQRATETNVVAEQPVADSESAQPSKDSADKKVAQLSDEKQAESARPDTGDNDQPSQEMRKNETRSNFVRTYHSRGRDRMRFSIERDDLPFTVERPPDGRTRPRLVTVIH
jgi:hypothetical protein